MSGLHVLVNLTWLVPGDVGGSEESTTDALRAVVEHHPELRVDLAVLGSFLRAHPDLAESCRCEVLDLGGAGRVARVLADQTWLAGVTARVAPDVVHHAGGVVPLRHPGRASLTVHDLQPLDLPANFSVAKRAYLGAMLGRSVRAAEVVCVPSAFTEHRVIDRLGAAPQRVRVVPWSVRPPNLPNGAPTAERGDGPTTFLYPAVTWPHKNHLVLLDAFARHLRTEPDARLLLPGGAGPADAEVAARLRRTDLHGRAERLGRVPRARLEELYATADAVLVPSRYEGFGLPAAEAMARGVPVVVADAGSLPEVVAGAELVAPPVDPDDVTGWTGAMQAVAALDPDRRSRLVASGLRRAGDFTPQRTAATLVDAWRDAAGAPTP